MSFHPFQGRPLFGHSELYWIAKLAVEKFPSLSGKTSIRTDGSGTRLVPNGPDVSIPFREDLYSD